MSRVNRNQLSMLASHAARQDYKARMREMGQAAAVKRDGTRCMEPWKGPCNVVGCGQDHEEICCHGLSLGHTSEDLSNAFEELERKMRRRIR